MNDVAVYNFAKSIGFLPVSKTYNSYLYKQQNSGLYYTYNQYSKTYKLIINNNTFNARSLKMFYIYIKMYYNYLLFDNVFVSVYEKYLEASKESKTKFNIERKHYLFILQNYTITNNCKIYSHKYKRQVKSFKNPQYSIEYIRLKVDNNLFKTYRLDKLVKYHYESNEKDHPKRGRNLPR